MSLRFSKVTVYYTIFDYTEKGSLAVAKYLFPLYFIFKLLSSAHTRLSPLPVRTLEKHKTLEMNNGVKAIRVYSKKVGHILKYVGT